jgi:hypothetical protein
LEPPSSNESLRIQKYAELLYEGGLRSVYANKAREQAGKSKLSESVVRDLFKKAGITVLDSDIKTWLPLLTGDTDMKIINDNIGLLKLQKDGAGTDFSKVNTLFDFVAYILDDLPNASTYPAKGASVLLSYVQPKASMYSSGATDYAHAWQRLCTAGITKIFNSEDNCRAYKNSLKYEEVKADLGDSMRLMSKEDLKSPFLAEIIKARFIAKGFSNNESIALYNKLAVMIADPYMPEQPTFIIKCDSCGFQNRFLSIQDAEKGKCSCGKELYIKCPSCKKPTPKSSDYCVNCSFLVAGIKNFGIYRQKALDALALLDFSEARKQLKNAKLADPSNPSAISLEKKINDEAFLFEKPLREIEALRSEKKLKAALRSAKEAVRQFPQLNFSDLQASVARLDKMFADSKRLAITEQVAACERILAECVDHDEAQLFLRSKPPNPSGGISLYCDEQRGCVNVSWLPSPDANVTYTLARKDGSIPVSPDERGVSKLLVDTYQSSYCDTKISSGIEYGYAVFAKRADVFSSGISDLIILCQDIGNLKQLEDGADGVLITWETPANCSNVTIFRKENGIPAIGGLALAVYEGLGGSFHDRGLATGQLYGYRIQASYATANGEMSSQGLTFTFKPKEKLMPFDLKVALMGTTVKFSCIGLRKECTVQVIRLKNPVPKDKVVKVRELPSLGTSLATFPFVPGTSSHTIVVPENSFYDVAAFAYFSVDAISSSTQTVNTYLPLPLVSRKARLDGTNIIFQLQDPIPASAKFVHYGLKNGESMLTSPSELSLSCKISIESCKRKRNEIFVNNPSGMRGACCLTLYAEYEIGGRKVLSAPDMLEVKVPMSISVEFRAAAKNLRSAVELSIRVQVAKGNVEFIPPLNLFAANELIATTDAIAIRNNQGSFSKVFQRVSLPKGRVRVRLVPEDSSWLGDLSMHWMPGFNGEI